jgi:hypothetical protein
MQGQSGASTSRGSSVQASSDSLKKRNWSKLGKKMIALLLIATNFRKFHGQFYVCFCLFVVGFLYFISGSDLEVDIDVCL